MSSEMQNTDTRELTVEELDHVVGSDGADIVAGILGAVIGGPVGRDVGKAVAHEIRQHM